MTRKILPLIPLFALAAPLLFAPASPSLIEAASGQAEKTRYCDAEAEANIDQAIRYLRIRLDTLKNDYEFDAKLPRKDDRVRRRMGDKINDIKVNCATRLRCRNATGKSAGIITDKIHICYEKAKNAGYSFCDLVGLIAHEYGHMIGMPRDLGHNRRDPKDATEMFGFFVGDLCRRDGVDRPLTAFSTPLNPRPAAPTGGIVLFPHANFEGRGRNFTGEFRDLRNIGRSDSFSSLRVLSGVWEAYEDRDFEGWRHLFNGNQADLRSIRFNDEISSLRPVTLPRRGITIFQHTDFRGGSRNFTGAIPDLRQVGINDQISSLQIHSGRWEVCRDINFGNCRTFDASQSDLGRSGLNEKISSLRPR